MRLDPPESIEEKKTNFVSRRLIQACSIEINAQIVVLWGATLPIALIVYPAAILAMCLSMSVNLVKQVLNDYEWIGAWADEHFWTIFTGTTAICVVISAVKLFTCFRRISVSNADRRTRPLSGPAGEKLVDVVKELWQSLPASHRPPPQIEWFPNFNVLARVAEKDESQLIQVSSALWERAARRDALAVNILAHELSHLVNRDGRRLLLLEAIVGVAQTILSVSITTMVLTVIGSAIVFVVSSAYTLTDLMWHFASISMFFALVLLIPVFALLIVRRGVALITALIEIRADVSAGLWTGGLAGFAEILSRDPDVKVSSLADMRHSLLSPRLTHLSNSERIALLRDPTRISTPKLRYFALSIALPFLLPLNPYTPLFAYGSLDYLLISAVVVAAHITTVAMIVSSGVTLRRRQVIVLAIFLCGSTCLPNINLYEIGYLLTHFSASLVTSGGFGLGLTTWGSITDDISVTLQGLLTKAINASGGGLFVLAVACSAIALRGISALAAQFESSLPVQARTRIWIIPSVIGGIITWASTYDESRAPNVLPFYIANNWFSLTGSIPWFRLCAPELSALIALILLVFVARRSQGFAHKARCAVL